MNTFHQKQIFDEIKKNYGIKIDLRYTDAKLSGHFGRKMLKKEKSDQAREQMAGVKFIQLNQNLNQLEKIWFLELAKPDNKNFSAGIW